MPARVPSNPNEGAPQAIVLLGCRVIAGAPGAALERRLCEAARAQQMWPSLPLVLSGGRSWDGHREADVMAAWLELRAQPSGGVHLERESLTTRQNALYTARLCGAHGYAHVLLVTCDFHMPRARRLFEEQRLGVTEFPARVKRSAFQTARLRFREWGAERLGRWEDLLG